MRLIVMVFAVLLTLCLPAQADWVTTTVPVWNAASALAVNPVTNKVYVTNQGHASITVIDGATNDTTVVAAQSEPFAVAVNPMTNKVYVANRGSNSVTAIDGATNETTLVAVGTNPR